MQKAVPKSKKAIGAANQNVGVPPTRAIPAAISIDTAIIINVQ